MAANQAVANGDLTDLVSSSDTTTIYPSDDAILAVLHARFRADLPYTRIANTSLLVVNPYKTLANVNDVNAREYEERCYKDTALPIADSPRPLQPHLYEQAAQVYLLMQRRQESQAVITRGITGSGKSSSLRLFVNQLLRLSAHSKKEAKIADQIQALGTLLDSFGNAKTLMNPNASRHGRYLELHFNDRGRINSAKVLTYGLDKARLARLSYEERTYHVFYQLLAGATPQERDALNLEDPSDYALLASSGCYRLPSGPFSDDSIGMSDLRAAMRTLGFKQKHTASIFSLLVAILLLGNLHFVDPDAKDVAAYVVNTAVLDHAARLLGVASDDLLQVLTNKTSYVRKELYTVLLNAEQATTQRDQCVRDLYAILFAFVVETANHRLAPNAKDQLPQTQIVLLDQPGFQNRGPSGTTSIALTGTAPLISAYGQNGFEEFCINLNDELLHSYVLRHSFEDVGYNGQIAGDGINLPKIATMDNGACVELLRGAQLDERSSRKPGGMLGVINKACSSFKSGKSGEHRDEDLLQEMASKFGVHASYIASPSVGGAQDRFLFGINHYAGSVSYDVKGFVEKDSDLLDSAYVTLLRSSADPFVSKLLSGPSLAAERHNKDENIVVQAQVSSRPLRHPSSIMSMNRTFQSQADEHARLDPSKTYPVSSQLNFTLSEIFSNIDRCRMWTITCIRPNDSSSPNSFDKRRVKNQIRSLLIPDLVARKSMEFVVDFEFGAFCDRFVPTMRGSEEERITQCVRANGWREGVDYALGLRCIWLSYQAWKMVEDILRNLERDLNNSGEVDEDDGYLEEGTDYTHGEGMSAGGHGGMLAPQSTYFGNESGDNLLHDQGGRGGNGTGAYGAGGLLTPQYQERGFNNEVDEGGAWSSGSRVGGGGGGSNGPPGGSPGSKEMVVKETANAVEEVPTTSIRRWWLRIVWLTTWMIPGFVLKHIGRMKRPDVQLAWREKVAIFWLIFLFNGIVIFYIVEFGRLLCPNFDKVWSVQDVSGHQGTNDYWVTIQGVVYDVTDFVGGQHSDIDNIRSNGRDTLEILAGKDLTDYFPVPLPLACPGLTDDWNLQLTVKNITTIETPLAMHRSSRGASGQSNALRSDDWYTARFLPKMREFRKGPLVWDKKTISAYAADQDMEKVWAIYENSIYDLTDYINTVEGTTGAQANAFLDSEVADQFKQRTGQDISQPLNRIFASMDPARVNMHKDCLTHAFYRGNVDFRKSARCQTQNYILIIFSGILMGSMGLKFLAALQLSSKRTPELQDKFVLCQVPCYTEDEDSLRRTIDTLAALDYDDKRKLIFIICDGNIIGSGNDRTTPRIVLDILGVDPSLDPEPLMFKSVGEGSRAINYGKIYSGLYEFEGHVVPYMVVVKVGKPTERSKPGNRGKRDSQILLMHYLNRVHFDAPMSPLELEIYHQMRNVIGIDPAFYEYIFTVDADTTVTPPSLNRLVASCADDSSIIGICGETKLENEQGSWWTMIQVYEYYISHHLSKAFESLFGSVTCLPGCFSLYRIRTADKGRPIIISNRIIDEYAEPNVDTLHKKNLFSLGEDRFLTTLMMKHFPTFKTKFCPDAVAHTMAPESWRILFSQRRRWINSTVHNLCELVLLPELFGFCCFSMRFFVFIDLLGTLILPATVVYLLYLIITVATKAAAFPVIAIIMLAVVYGLQAIIFILKREFMLIGWMVVYILSYPVYSFFLPVYSFWCMDEFSWGNTRVVVGEGKEKKVLMSEEEKFDESMIPLKKFSEYEAEAWETGSRRSDDTGYDTKSRSRYTGGGRSRDHSPGGYKNSNNVSGSQHGGDYYRDTNLTNNNSSNPNLKLGGSQMSHSNISHGHNNAQSQYGMPQLPFMPFGGGPGSVTGGSDYGGNGGMMQQMPMAPMGYQNTGSMYGMPMMGMGMGGGMGMGMMGNNSSWHGSQSGGLGGPLGGGVGGVGAGPFAGGQRPMSTFSMATTMNPFASPSSSENPTDEELFMALRNYLSTQDLMTVTKKTAREAMAARFPKADLSSRKDFLNQSIDKILSES